MSRAYRIGLRTAWRNLRRETGWTWKQFVAAIRAAEEQRAVDREFAPQESNERAV